MEAGPPGSSAPHQWAEGKEQVSSRLLCLPLRGMEQRRCSCRPGASASSGTRAWSAPGAEKGYGPPPQKLSGPQATPSTRALQPYKESRQLAN